MSATAEQTDERLVRDARAGDLQAFDALIERHMGVVYAIACARLGDRERAEDLVQEVFLRVFLALDKLDRPERIAAWLGRITRNLAIDWQRRERSASRLVPLVPLDERGRDLPDTRAKGVRQQMEAHERETAVWQALLKLPPEEREAVMLHFTEEMTATEIARRLGVHQTTITRRLQRALASMRGLLEPVLREVAPALRVSPRVTTRTLGLIAAAAAMSAASKATLAAKATQEISVLGQAPAAAAGVLGLLKTAIIAGGSIMATGKGIVATAVTAALIGGGVYLGTRSQESPPQGEMHPVPEIVGGVQEIVPQEARVGQTRPTIEIIRPEQGPNAESTPLPRINGEPELEAVLSHLGGALAQNLFPPVPPNATLFVHGSGITLDRFEFRDWNLSTPSEPAPLTPSFRQVSQIGGPWVVTFDRPLTGQILMAVYRMPPPENEEFCWLASVEGAPPPNPDVVAQIEASARQDLAQRAGSSPVDQSVSRVRSDMRATSVAIETYYVDFNDFPPSVMASDPRSVNAADSLSSQMPGFRGAALTTPIAYLTRLFPDPFSATGQATFAYERFAPGDPWQSVFGGYGLFSPGPDRDWDFQFMTLYVGNRVHPTDTTGAVFGALYDPTNGLTSSGDIVRASATGMNLSAF
jgi:RNA polymerase sigma factor (sigma-70 family)